MQKMACTCNSLVKAPVSAQIFGDGCKSRRHTDRQKHSFTNAATVFKERQLKQYLWRRRMNTNDRWIRYRDGVQAHNTAETNVYLKTDSLVIFLCQGALRFGCVYCLIKVNSEEKKKKIQITTFLSKCILVQNIFMI
ncbi:hypothetical protein B5X24_HaOG205213 [Helicoverpa armigera]|uniref:Uncharacterized protein n=1 Tax=Helicoverpa armigera TaxID=29058 RepID=A0A2W1BP17_HELAM|nr:hypothetical protein B5X24_HaOG205213 [Helicoverpa armigera]